MTKRKREDECSEFIKLLHTIPTWDKEAIIHSLSTLVVPSTDCHIEQSNLNSEYETHQLFVEMVILADRSHWQFRQILDKHELNSMDCISKIPKWWLQCEIFVISLFAVLMEKLELIDDVIIMKNLMQQPYFNMNWITIYTRLHNNYAEVIHLINNAPHQYVYERECMEWFFEHFKIHETMVFGDRTRLLHKSLELVCRVGNAKLVRKMLLNNQHVAFSNTRSLVMITYRARNVAMFQELKSFEAFADTAYSLSRSLFSGTVRMYEWNNIAMLARMHGFWKTTQE
jgi:hypothetical protein